MLLSPNFKTSLFLVTGSILHLGRLQPLVSPVPTRNKKEREFNRVGITNRRKTARLISQQPGEVVEVSGDFRMLFAVDLLVDGQGLSVERLRLIELALRAQERSTTQSVAQQHESGGILKLA